MRRRLLNGLQVLIIFGACVAVSTLWGNVDWGHVACFWILFHTAFRTRGILPDDWATPEEPAQKRDEFRAARF